jgi:carbon-monoxide dehydrogenase medium subunit
MALGASVTLQSTSGKRTVPLKDFFTGVRGTVMRPDEMLVDIFVPAMQSSQRGMFIKLGFKASPGDFLVNTAVVLEFEVSSSIERGRITKQPSPWVLWRPPSSSRKKLQEYLKGKQPASRNRTGRQFGRNCCPPD